jgi:SlyX protein
MTQDTRFTAIEEQLAHQGVMIDELSETISEQWKTIERLTRKLASLAERVSEHEEAIGEAFPATKPPHY